MLVGSLRRRCHGRFVGIQPGLGDAAPSCSAPSSPDVQVAHVERVLLDELAARLDRVAHQRREDVLGLVVLGRTCSSVRVAGSIVVSQSSSAFISPRPL